MKKEQWQWDEMLFAAEKDVVKYTADQVYNDFLDGKVDLKKAATELKRHVIRMTGVPRRWTRLALP